MTTMVACVVCARPLGHLLTGGLQAGVLVMALVAASVVAAMAWGAVRIAEHDRASATETPSGGASASASPSR